MQPPADDGTLVVVGKGMLALKVEVDGLENATLSLLYPGDVVTRVSIPAGVPVALTATCASELIRTRIMAGEDGAKGEGVSAQLVARSLGALHARLAMHAAMVANLDARTRVASLMIEFAHRLGQPAPRGLAFEMPVSRVEAASYIGINADTFSRIVSQLKSEGVLSQNRRRGMIVLDWPALRAMSPFSASLEALHRSGGQFTGPVAAFEL